MPLERYVICGRPLIKFEKKKIDSLKREILTVSHTDFFLQSNREIL
jgi:hypothetical protein